MLEINNFLKDKFNLHASKEVQNAVKRHQKNTGKRVKNIPNELIGVFLKRFDDILALKENQKDKSIEGFKRKIFSQYIIKPEEIPVGFWNLQKRILRERGMGDMEIPQDIKNQETERIITEQQKSLENWIFYLSHQDANYDMGLKYWAFRSILSLQNFDREKGVFLERSKGTVATFPELNQEALSYTFEFITRKIKGESIYKPGFDIDDNEFQEILKKENFAEIYAFAFKSLGVLSDELLKETKGKWVKYKKGSNHMMLVNSIRGKGTGWCTAGESTAKTQLSNGDFYVYYSLDEKGGSTIPRIAIRTGYSGIQEIRGILKHQELDSYILPILHKKLEEFGTEGEKYQKSADDMKKMTLIDNKVSREENLSREDLSFLYEINREIKGFGYYKDPRIEEIKSRRDIGKDLSIVFDCQKHQISTSKKEFLDGNIIYHYGNLELNLDDIERGVLILPKHIVGSLTLKGTGENLRKLVLPEFVRGNCECSELISVSGVIFPKKVGGNFDLRWIEKIPNDFHIETDVLGLLNLSGLKSIKSLSFIKLFNGSIELSGLKKLTGLELPGEIFGNLILGGDINGEGEKFDELDNLPKGYICKLPIKIGGTLKINIKSAKGIVFPEHIGENLHFSSLNTRDGLDLSKTKVGGKTDMLLLKMLEISRSPGFRAHMAWGMRGGF